MSNPTKDIEGTISRISRLRDAGKFIVTGLEVYPNGSAQIIREAEAKGDIEPGAKRGEVRGYSRQARERFAFVSRETIVTFHSLMTLSYGKQFPTDGKEVKKHLNRFLVWYRRNIGGEYIWWLEFQQRGAPHIHIASQKQGITVVDRQQFSAAWRRSQGACYPAPYTDLDTGETRTISNDVYRVHKHPKQWQEKQNDDGPKRYIMKYALKMRQKVVPKNYLNVGRFFGWSRGVKAGVPEPKRVAIYETELRDKLAKQGHIAADWPYLPKNLYGIHAKKFNSEI